MFYTYNRRIYTYNASYKKKGCNIKFNLYPVHKLLKFENRNQILKYVKSDSNI